MRGNHSCNGVVRTVAGCDVHTPCGGACAHHTDPWTLNPYTVLLYYSQHRSTQRQNDRSMQNQALVFCNRVVSPLCTSSFCGRRKFLKRALWAKHPSRSFKAHRTSQHCTRCLVATGGSDDEDDEPKQQPTPSTSGRGQGTASSGLGLNPDLEQPVPSEQRPVNELAALRETWLYSWVSCGLLHACNLLFARRQHSNFVAAYAAGQARDTVILVKAGRCLAWLLRPCGWTHCISNI